MVRATTGDVERGQSTSLTTDRKGRAGVSLDLGAAEG